EAAAGAAGLIKAALALHNERIPASLHCAEPNPHIPFDELGLAAPSRTAAWPGPREGRVAGVSSFGFGGTNAHVVPAAAPPAEAAADPARVLGSAKGLAARSPRVAFAFSGQGSLWPGMGRRLLVADPLFRSAIRRCDETLAQELGWSVEAALLGDGPAHDLDD